MLKPSVSLTLQKDYPYSPFSPAEFEQGLFWAAENGFTGVEIAICDPGTVNADRLYHQLSDLHLSFVTIATGQAYGLEGLSLSDPDESVRNRAVERIKAQICLSRSAGFPKVTIGSLRGAKLGKDPKKTLENLADSLLYCAEFADRNGVMLNFEPINQKETEILRTCPETLAFFEQKLHGCPGIGVLFDTYHSDLEGRDPAGDVFLLGSHISHVHFADRDRKLPGFGGIDFPAVVKALKEIGYSGFISLETKNIPNVSFARVHAGKALSELLK